MLASIKTTRYDTPMSFISFQLSKVSHCNYLEAEEITLFDCIFC